MVAPSFRFMPSTLADHSYCKQGYTTLQMVELDPTPETPKSPLQKVQNMYNNMISTVKQASPLHRKRSSAPNPFRETPRSASNVKPETGARIQLQASSQ